MLIGVDFDNTIVSYDALFHRIAVERGLIPANLPANKTAVRDHLRAIGAEDVWTEMQGEVYGARMSEAAPFPGVLEFFRACRERSIAVVIVSHKTRHPFRGPPHDLHAAARAWLRQHGFFDAAHAGLNETAVHFELTKAEKLARIAALGCTHFIDDLPEILGDAAFPQAVQRLLFAPENTPMATTGLHVVNGWVAVREMLLGREPWLEAAASILSRTGRSFTGEPESLTGGANNRVAKLVSSDGRRVVVKRYFRREGDARDRFATEKAFYHFALAAGAEQVPSVFGWNEREQVGVFSYVNGERLTVAGEDQVRQALQFFRALNRARHLPEARELPLASEACFSLEAHLATVERRVAALQDLPRDDALDESAGRFVRETLIPTGTALAAELRHGPSAADASGTLSESERCVSPSDFGFHNSLSTADGRLVFYDFEYAGWDDPAKLVCDFFCQPDVPAPIEEFDRFASFVAETLALPDVAAFSRRCRLLLPLYQTKWACILLNEFTPTGRARRTFAIGASAACARRSRQLVRARSMIASPRLAA